jgi:hypothetical protein
MTYEERFLKEALVMAQSAVTDGAVIVAVADPLRPQILLAQPKGKPSALSNFLKGLAKADTPGAAFVTDTIEGDVRYCGIFVQAWSQDAFLDRFKRLAHVFAPIKESLVTHVPIPLGRKDGKLGIPILASPATEVSRMDPVYDTLRQFYLWAAGSPWASSGKGCLWADPRLMDPVDSKRALSYFSQTSMLWSRRPKPEELVPGKSLVELEAPLEPEAVAGDVSAREVGMPATDLKKILVLSGRQARPDLFSLNADEFLYLKEGWQK